MARDPESREIPSEDAILEQLQAALSGRSPAELQAMLQQLMASRTALTGVLERPPPPSRRRPRRTDTVTYRVRADLTGTRPPLWRRLELASDLFLDQVHEVMQAAFGWTDSHLHQFGSGSGHYDPGTEQYLCPFQVEEGEPGIPEGDVRLDEVLAEPGDKLLYLYDFGDDWKHTIKLEAIAPRPSSAPRATCITGRREGPPEDCGGVGAYELICAATDPRHPAHADAVTEFTRFYGGDLEPGSMRTTPFDINEVNDVLAGLDLAGEPASGTPGPGGSLPGPVDDLLHAIRTSAGQRELRRLLDRARLDKPVLLDAATAARMVHPYSWLLDHVGDGGIKLTSAGYLPPLHVAAAVAELRLSEEWIGKGNRESQTLPVLHLRESATAMGLLRKRNGMLLLTSRARTVRTDPAALWWHLAQRMPPASRDECENQAGLILLAVIAARAEGDPDLIIARLLSAIGWVTGSGSGLNASAAGQACWDTRTALRRLGGITGGWRSEAPSAEGITFARAALQSWPGR
ncbi:MAG TPA: plasmid pRiA4b ORF-3 family protein [Streptosporangiaceae bacterium]|nr:plasmid pRiA4b ORF-3 family protein [Streptosporangiaceae bacterium]